MTRTASQRRPTAIHRLRPFAFPAAVSVRRGVHAWTSEKMKPNRAPPVRPFGSARLYHARSLGGHIGVSERELWRLARAHGACRIIGKPMFPLPKDVETIWEVLRPFQSNSTSAADSSTTEGPLPEGDYAALRKRLTKKPPNASRQKLNTGRGGVVSMDRGRG